MDGKGLIIFIQLLYISLFLSIIGEPLRFLFAHHSSFFRKLDLMQSYVTDVYLGGLIVYTVAMIPLGLFDVAISWGLVVIGIVLSILLHRDKLKTIKKIFPFDKLVRVKINDYLSSKKVPLLVFAMFIMVLWIQILAVTNFIFGSIHDTSLHALFVQLILENKGIPETHSPYVPAAIIYPQASHAVFAYASHILVYPPPKAVFYITPLFSAMSVLAAYHLGKKHQISSEGHLGLSLSFVMAFVSAWPLYVTWGGNPFVLGFPLFLICLGLFSYVWDSNPKWWEYAIVGVLFGYLASIQLAYYETLIVSMILWLVLQFFRDPMKLRAKIGGYLGIFAFSLLPLSPFLYRFIAFYHYPGHNIGLPPDFMGYSEPRLSLDLQFKWIFDNISPYPLLRWGFAFLLIISGVTILIKCRDLLRSSHCRDYVGLVVFCSSVILICLSYLPQDIWGIIPHGSVGIIAFIPFYLLVALFNVYLYSALNKPQHAGNALWRPLIKPFIKKSGRTSAGRSLAALFLIFFVMFGPFVYSRVVLDRETLTGAYRVFAVTTQDDQDLMLWMRDDLPYDAVVLINPYEPGTFIPSVSHHRVVFPFTADQRSYSYQKLTGLIEQGIMNATTYSLMKRFNVTHVYVGSQATYWWESSHKWNPAAFSNERNFKLIKNIGDAYLFAIQS